VRGSWVQAPSSVVWKPVRPHRRQEHLPAHAGKSTEPMVTPVYDQLAHETTLTYDDIMFAIQADRRSLVWHEIWQLERWEPSCGSL